VGEAAFYGPKLDFIFKDVLGREWQLSTIQLDMNLPKRFDLEYVDEKGTKREPVVIHRAILGSTERFLGILIEHFAGNFPLWLAPVQVKVLAVSDKQKDYAEKVYQDLMEAGIRVELAPSDETLGKRIREAEMQKIPYIAVVGETEMNKGTLNLRIRGQGQGGESSVADFVEHIRQEVKNLTLN
ncbi:MAG: threonine--tRNA ligase, partial [Candidatus Taylorbacteria bacterium]|nr:threonine--tRNA ligase [Candidatus Taylorbacteria bacterium]